MHCLAFTSFPNVAITSCRSVMVLLRNCLIRCLQLPIVCILIVTWPLIIIPWNPMRWRGVALNWGNTDVSVAIWKLKMKWFMLSLNIHLRDLVTIYGLSTVDRIYLNNSWLWKFCGDYDAFFNSGLHLRITITHGLVFSDMGITALLGTSRPGFLLRHYNWVSCSRGDQKTFSHWEIHLQHKR